MITMSAESNSCTLRTDSQPTIGLGKKKIDFNWIQKQEQCQCSKFEATKKQNFLIGNYQKRNWEC